MRPLKVAKKLKSYETGVTLIETVIALALLGLIAVGFIGGLGTTYRAVMVSQERVAAESLAKSQLDYIIVQNYITAEDYNPYDPESCYELIDIPDELVDKGYDIEITPPQTIVTPSEGNYEVQGVTVVIKRNGEELLIISDYKVGIGS